MPHGVGLWKGITRELGEFSWHTNMKVGAGRRAKFRKHVWFGDVMLRDAPVSMFHLAVERGRGGLFQEGWRDSVVGYGAP